MKTLSKSEQQSLTPTQAIELLRHGNERFVKNLKLNRNLLQQMNETREGQNPFAVIISCMDSRTSAELIFDQGLGDIFSIRIAGNIVNDEILGSTEFGTFVVGAKVVMVVGHSRCGAVKGAIERVQLGHLESITKKIQRAIPKNDLTFNTLSDNEKMAEVTHENVHHSLEDLRTRSKIIADLEESGKLALVGGVYDIASGQVEFFDHPSVNSRPTKIIERREHPHVSENSR